MSIWPRKLQDAGPLPALTTIPLYVALFFWKNAGPFRGIFLWLTLCSVIAAILNFYTVYLLGELISQSMTIRIEEVFQYYLPLYVAAAIAKQILDYLIRRYGEAIPAAYAEYTLLRFYHSLLSVRSKRMPSVSKERLYNLITRYIANIEGFLRDWFWGVSRRSVEFFLVVGILYNQSPVVCALNLAYMVGFLILSFRISRSFANIAMDFSQSSIVAASRYTNFFLLLNSVRRLGRREFFTQALHDVSADRLQSLDSVRRFHARRWLLQLTLFDVLYVGTLFFGVYQVLQHTLPLGYLVLLRYAFTQLWEILVYAIEYYVRLISERQDAQLLRAEFEKAEFSDHSIDNEPALRISGFKELSLRDITLRFASQQSGDLFTLQVPSFTVEAKDRIGVVGKSGAGKSTFLHLLLNSIPFSGSFCIDGVELEGRHFDSEDVSFISSYDPLFNLSVRANIELGRTISPEKFTEILNGVCLPLTSDELNQDIGAGNVQLSTGEAQRVRLARGMLQNAELYIFDEPFTGIDSGTKIKILQFLDEYLRDKTIILVTHDEAELQWMDRVYRMEKGVLYESGPESNC